MQWCWLLLPQFGTEQWIGRQNKRYLKCISPGLQQLYLFWPPSHHTVHWLSSEIWSVSLNGVQVLQDLHKLAALKYMYAVDGGKAHWRPCAAYLNSRNVERMIRKTNHRLRPLPPAQQFPLLLSYGTFSLQTFERVSLTRGCVKAARNQSLRRNCHFKQIGLKRIKLCLFPVYLSPNGQKKYPTQTCTFYL